MNLNSFAPDRLIKERVINHVLCWALFITYELGLVYYSFGRLEHAYVYIIYYPIHISYFYLYILLLNSIFDKAKPRYLSGFLRILMLFAAYMVVKFLADYLLEVYKMNIASPFIYIQGAFTRNFGRGLYFTVLATFYWSAGHISHFRRQSIAAEKQQLQAEKEKAVLEVNLERSRNAYLQQQINPHMLFNSLNFVYNTVQLHSEDAAHCIWLLSEIMRFSLEDTDTDGKVLVVKETEQIENLVAINRYRFREPLYLTAVIDLKNKRLRIIPLILLTLTENLFKHGDLTDKMQPALLQITTDDPNRLSFLSRNLKKSKNEHNRREGLGLINIRVRLDALYTGQYNLAIVESDTHYELTLTLAL